MTDSVLCVSEFRVSLFLCSLADGAAASTRLYEAGLGFLTPSADFPDAESTLVQGTRPSQHLLVQHSAAPGPSPSSAN